MEVDFGGVVAISQDERWLVTGSCDDTARVYGSLIGYLRFFRLTLVGMTVAAIQRAIDDLDRS